MNYQSNSSPSSSSTSSVPGGGGSYNQNNFRQSHSQSQSQQSYPYPSSQQQQQRYQIPSSIPSPSSSSSSFPQNQNRNQNQQHQNQQHQNQQNVNIMSTNSMMNNGIKVPPGTLQPGTIIRVGEYKVRVDKFLSEGGFAHVYLATSEYPISTGGIRIGSSQQQQQQQQQGSLKHVLKRIQVMDLKGVEEVGREVDVMKLLRSHPKIVNFIEASVNKLPSPSGSGEKEGNGGGGGYEIYILMEWCPGGGIIDMLNTRLQERLTESEILKIFSDTVEAVAHMHYQSPPLIHRDLKVENILLSPNSQTQTYKLCDFGSTSTPLLGIKIPSAVADIQELEREIGRATTLQYRAPELVDVWGRKGFDEKVDIWALGVFLYKLCYYTTPFEEQGPLAILSATYTIPPYPAYSNSIKGLINSMLKEKASDRPNIYQVHEGVCKLRGTAIRLENKYANLPTSSSASTPSMTKQLPLPPPSSSSSATPTQPQLTSGGTNISPMRRGRPSKVVPVTSTTIGATTTKTSEVLQDVLSSTGNDWDKPFAKSVINPSWPGGNFSGSTGGSTVNGFGESFSPAFSSSTPTPNFNSVPFTSTSNSNTFSSASNTSAALFADLLPPSNSTSNSRMNTPMINMTNSSSSSSGSPLPSASFTTPPVVTSPIQFDDSFITSSIPISSTSTSTSNFFSNSFVPTSTSKPITKFISQLTGEPKKEEEEEEEEKGPILPRRPHSLIVPTSTSSTSNFNSKFKNFEKPELVSRASQTSPALMSDWNSSSLSPGTQLPLQAQARSQNTSTPTFDLLGDDEDEMKASIPQHSHGAIPTYLSNSSPRSRPSSALSITRGKFRPTKPEENFVDPPISTTGSSSPISLTSALSKVEETKLEVEDRFPALDQMDSKPLDREEVVIQKKEKEEQWQSIVEKEEDSSDGEPEETSKVEEIDNAEFSPSNKWKEISKSSTSSSSSSNNNNNKFIPVRQSIIPPPPPSSSSDSTIIRSWNSTPIINSVARTSSPLIAPQPQSVQRQVAISSLVSRYETISTEPLSVESKKVPPPPLASKPAELRRVSREGGLDRRNSNGQGVVDNFEQRFPTSGALANHFSSGGNKSSNSSVVVEASTFELSPATTPTIIKSRPLFKPVPPLPPSSSSSSSPRRAPSLASLIAKSSATMTKEVVVQEKEEEEEEEPRFMGVSNMRNKWENLNR